MYFLIISYNICVAEESNSFIPLQSNIIDFIVLKSLIEGCEGCTNNEPYFSILNNLLFKSPTLVKFKGSGILIIKTPSISSISAIKLLNLSVLLLILLLLLLFSSTSSGGDTLPISSPSSKSSFELFENL